MWTTRNDHRGGMFLSLLSRKGNKTRKPFRVQQSSILLILFLFLLTLLWVGINYRLLYYSVSDSSVPADNNLSMNHLHLHRRQSSSNDQRNIQQDKRPIQPIKIAHAVSLITCKKASRVRGFLDALIILRHSIHQNSIHNRFSNSNYSYQMFAFVHESDARCVAHVPLLRRLGYIPLLLPPPVNISHIVTNDWYRQHVPREKCCGDAEFIKLYAYNLTDYPVVVHWDLDVAVLQPMDELYDAMLYDKDSTIGRSARKRLQVQHPQSSLPDRIDAYFTRDVTSSYPWEQVQGVQGGFVVARPNPHHLALYQQFILEANYTPGGRGPHSGWGGLGYGGFQGAMAYQGVVAYFYDHVHPGHAVELDVCRWNQVVADVIYRGPERPEMMGRCRQYNERTVENKTNRPELGGCEDCRVLPVEQTKTVHFTACKKPWECTLPYPRVPGPKMKAHTYRLQELTNVTTCGLLFRKYFEIRHEVESLIFAALQTKPAIATGDFQPDYFLGYCHGRGRYTGMNELPADFDMKQVYGF